MTVIMDEYPIGAGKLTCEVGTHISSQAAEALAPYNLCVHQKDIATGSGEAFHVAIEESS